MDTSPQNLVSPRQSTPAASQTGAPGIIDAAAAQRAEVDALHANGRHLSALCLSGGGIRSAAFSLGVIQAFARQRVLRDFDYLSTVSGGGYTGAWLTRLIADQNGDVAKAEDMIANRGPGGATQPEPTQIRNLRRYTNYLTPNPGLASADTWAGIVLWLRNTLINWAVFLPLALAAAAIPVFCLNVVCWGAWFGPDMATSGFWAFEYCFADIALAGLCIAAFNTCLGLPSHTRTVSPNAPVQGLSGLDVWMGIGGFTLLWVFLAPLAAAPLLSLTHMDSVQNAFCPVARSCFGTAALPPPPATPPLHWRRLMVLPASAWLVSVFAYLAAAVSVALRFKDDDWQAHLLSFIRNFPNWVFSAAVSAALLYLGARLVYGHSALWVSLAGPAWVLVAEIIRSAVYVAIRARGLNSELDREWLARLNGDKLRLVLLISLLGATAVWLPMVVLDFKSGPVGAVTVAFGIATGPAAAWLGKTASSVFSYGENSGDLFRIITKRYAVLIAASLFGLTMFMIFGRVILNLAGWLSAGWLNSRLPLPALGEPHQQAFGAAAIAVAILAACCLGLALLVDRFVNLNRFSMHAVYRNRLIRAFLGTARENGKRQPDAYTFFDPNDNIRLADTWDGRTLKKLFPIINVSLNYTSGRDTARAERKAEAFTFSPLHCGGGALCGGQGAYFETALYAGGEKETGPGDQCRGITLGTAMAISGAAASPNMGYNSSPAAAFLMTLFNVRLGAWLPNPGCGFIRLGRMAKSGPVLAIPTMLQELTGRSNDQGKYIYLSDGGHFDNLGLYEMLRRRCRHIVVVDASADPKYGFFDLGHTLDIAAIDFGVKVTFSPGIATGADPGRDPAAFGDITYLDGTTGKLLYLKPCRPKDLPIQLAAYGVIKPEFPHESTLDQFFTESDFESYRLLGEALAGRVLAKTAHHGAPRDLASVFCEACNHP